MIEVAGMYKNGPTIRCVIKYIIYVSCKIRMNYYISPLRHTLYRTISLLYLSDCIQIIKSKIYMNDSLNNLLVYLVIKYQASEVIKNFWFLYQLTTNLLYKYLEMCNLSLRYFPSVDFISQNHIMCVPAIVPNQSIMLTIMI